MGTTRMTAMTADAGYEAIEWIDEEQASILFDALVRDLMHISGDEFIRRWDAGEYAPLIEDPAHAEVVYLAGLIPFARPDAA
jgi:hypothetical protein